MTDDPLIATFFEEAGELLAEFEAGLLQLEARADDVALLDAIFRSAHTLKGNSAMLGFEGIAHVTHGLEDLLDHLRKGRRPVSAPVVDALLYGADVMRTLLARARAGGEPTPAEHATAEDLMAALAVLLAADEPSGEHPASARAGGGLGVLSRGAPMFRDETASLRVPVEKLDGLVDLVGELIITQSMIADAVAAFTPERVPSLRTAVALMDRHARELHERVMGIRMVPIRTLFGRFPRLVRDVAASVGKSAALEMSGEETELDRTVVEKISDPLAHLVRNAVDHGLETPDARRALGKPEVGRLGLTAYQQGGNIYIELADDGRGLDRDRIWAKARELGLTGDEPLSDEQIFGMIFRPGFSTAETVTELSGRGVGMDVVRRNVEALGGSIAIRSARGRGTTFRVTLPLTLAILDGQLLSVGTETYVLPLASIVESMRPRAAQLGVVLGAGEMITLRDRVLPMLRLHRLLGVSPKSEDPTDGLLVIVDQDGRQAALLVDELLGQQPVVIKSLERHFDKVRGVAGATILGDGRVTLILDVPGLVALAGMREVVAT
jgi:two-component system chemotaxis sensor kinase CheA